LRVGAFLAGGAAWFNSRFQMRIQAKHERRKLILQKMEEVHELLSQYKQSYKMLTAEFLRIYASGEQELGELEPIPLERLKMLVGFYAPVLGPQLQTLEEHSESYGDRVAEHIQLGGKSDTSAQKKRLGFLLLHSETIGKSCEAMQQEVIQLSKSYF